MSILGIDIGGTKCAVCLGELDGTVIVKVTFPTNQQAGAGQALDQFFSHADALLEKHHTQVEAIGISCGSPIDTRTGEIHFTAQLRSWRGTDVKDVFARRFGVPVHIENDANAGALAEYLFGAGRGCRHMAFLTFGTGLGAGLILDGRIYAGANGYAGEIGHMRLADDGPVGCDKPGSFEGFCSGHGIAQLAAIELQRWDRPTVLSPGATCRDVAQAAFAGDALARHVFRESGRRLGQGLALVNDVLNLQRIIIGSVFLRCEELLRPTMEEAFRAEAMAPSAELVEILPAGLGEAIGDYAALAVAISRMDD